MTCTRNMLIVDLFCGGGGVSYGIEEALGQPVTVAVNHDPVAIAMHRRNHPSTRHFEEDVFDVDPWVTALGDRVDLLWASPDCTHFSRARGGRPMDKGIRSLADVVVEWACSPARPWVICVENVPEFEGWGPLDDDGKVIKARKGEYFKRWVRGLERAGYVVEWRVLTCCDYGDPTSRKRLFVVARCDGKPIVWPEPTHGPEQELPYRTAAECIDFTDLGRSIFGRSKPLAAATQRRIAAGVKRYVLDTRDPFLIEVGDEVVVPFLYPNYGERRGQPPRTRTIERPMPTVTGSMQWKLCAAFLAKHYGGPNGKQTPGQDLRDPMPALPSRAQVGPVYVEFGGAVEGARQVAAFLMAYYGSGGQLADLRDPMPTLVSRDRFGLVTVEVDGEHRYISDIRMRMLQPREAARAHSFPEDYQLLGTKRGQTEKVGRSVPARTVEAVARAQFGLPSRWDEGERRAAK